MRRFVLLSILAAFSTACGGDGGGTAPTPASLTLSTAAHTLTSLGANVQLTATARDAGGTVVRDPQVTWTSSAPAVATVDGMGLVTSVADGSATVTASYQSLTATSAITVAQRASTMSVEPLFGQVVSGTTLQMTATPRDARGIEVVNKVLSWSTSDPQAATVDASGLLTAGRTGTVTVSVSMDGAGAESNLEVIRADLTPQADTVLAGVVELGTLDIPAGVTVTASDDLVLDVLETANVTGTVTGACLGMEMLIRGQATVSGTIRNTCAALPGGPGPQLTLSLIGDATLDGALVESSGAILIRADTTTTLDDGLAAAPVRAPGPRAATTEARDLTVLGSTVRITPGEMPAGADGGAQGGNGQDARPLVLSSPGRIILDGSTFETGRGGRGGNAEASGNAQTVTATGGNGGNGGAIAIVGATATRITRDRGAVVMNAGPGGWGGNAVATTSTNAELPTAPGATARGGKAGDAGTIRLGVRSALGSNVLDVVVWSGGQGGRAEARAADGVNATTDRDAQPGGSAVAEGGRGGDATILDFTFAQPLTTWVDATRNEGVGGEATATAGKGGNGITSRPDGAAGGNGEARGGSILPGSAVDLAGILSRGGNATVTGGNGGRGASACFPQAVRDMSGLIRVLSDPGNSDQFVFNAGTGGKTLDLVFNEDISSRGGNGGAGGSLTAQSGSAIEPGLSVLGPGANGGNGGNGIPAGAAGAGGTVVPSSVGGVDFQQVLGQPGTSGAPCPPSAPQASVVMALGPQQADGTHPITLTGAAPWINVTGTMAQDGTVTAEGLGVMVGFPNIRVTFDGTFDSATGQLTGSYAMDTEKVIDAGHPVTYGVDVTQQGG